MYKLKTIDVWDTLIRRRCHPDFVKLATARYFYFKYFNLHNVSDLTHLFEKRVEIEVGLGLKIKSDELDDEYELHDVLHHFVKAFITSSFDTLRIADDLFHFEVENEKKLTYPDPHIKDVLDQYPAEKTLFLSDFYMSGNKIQELLDHHGINKFVPAGVSSVDVHLNKRSGKLFDYIGKTFTVAPNDWVHFGDNEWSDVKVPSSKGIKSIHFLPKPEHDNRITKESYFSNKTALFTKIEAEILSGLKETDNIFILGVKSSPFMIGFCLHILEKAIESKSEKIYFFTREGEFFIKVFSSIISYINQSMPDLKLPKYQLLEVSRLATFCPSLQSVSLTEMMRLWNLYSSQSIGALLKTLGVDETPLSLILDNKGLTLDEVIQYPWQDARVISLFEDKDFLDYIKENIATKREQILGYFNDQGLNSASGCITVVDVGWRGTIQDNIALLLPNVKFVGVYLGLQKYLNPQPENSIKFAYGPDINKNIEYPHFLDSVAPIEMITNSPTGSVVGYVREGDNYIAVKKISSEENEAFYSFTERYQEGILYAVNHWNDFILSSVITSQDLRDAAIKVWSDLIAGKNSELNSTYANLDHNETFGLGGYVNKSNVPSIADVFKGVICKSKRSEVIAFVKANQWPEGINRRADLSKAHRFLLSSLIRVAIYYKNNHMKRL
ncbi:hypothetical protein ASE93_14665 [Serratia sp. Leaf50]|nr:hypothetical protein ASE93_14665 [Serratia sp. Leaf50]